MKNHFFQRAITELLPTLRRRLPQLRHHYGEVLTDIERTFGPVKDFIPYYVVPYAQNLNPADVDEDNSGLISKNNIFDLLDSFLAGAPRFSHAFVLSDAGMGKSSLLVTLRLLSLADLIPSSTFIDLLKLGPDTLARIHEIADPSNHVLLLDALDEDPGAWLNLYSRVQALLRATEAFRKVIITCRTQFFPHEYEEDGRVPGVIALSGFHCSKLFLAPFSDEQVDEYLSRRFTTDSDRSRAKEIVQHMHSLKFRPMLLSYIEFLLEEPTALTYSYAIYEALVEEWLNRELRKGVVDDKAVLREACRIIALYLYESKDRDIDSDKLIDLCAQIEGIRRLEQLSIEGRSLLHRTSAGRYKFAHYSILEFFVASDLVQTARSFGNTDQVVAFIGDLLVYRKKKNAADLRLKGLKVIGKLDSVTFRGAILIGSDFRGSSLKGAVFKKADLGSSNFSECNLENANFEGAVITRAVFNRSNMRHTRLLDLDFSSCELQGAILCGSLARGCNFNSTKLDEADLRGMDAEGSNFAEASIAKGDLSDTNFAGVRFDKSHLVRASLTGSGFTGCSFKDAKLDGSIADRANFANAILSGVQAKGASFAKACLREARCDGISAQDSDFSEIDGIGVDFGAGNLRGARFLESELGRSSFKKSMMSESTLHGARAEKGDFEELVGERIDFSEAILRHAVFCDANLTGGKFAGADLAFAKCDRIHAPGADFSNAKLTGPSFLNANLSNSNFQSCYIRDVSFAGSKLQGACFDGCRLENVTFTGANLDGALFGNSLFGSAVWKNARYDSKTTWPRGFGVPRDGIGPGALLADRDLSKFNLVEADLNGCDCRRTNFFEADLRRVNLSVANLENSDLRGANLRGARLDGAKIIGARYNRKTVLPDNISPLGMVLVGDVDPSVDG